MAELPNLVVLQAILRRVVYVEGLPEVAGLEALCALADALPRLYAAVGARRGEAWPGAAWLGVAWPGGAGAAEGESEE